jgi:hypothetical protein
MLWVRSLRRNQTKVRMVSLGLCDLARGVLIVAARLRQAEREEPNDGTEDCDP